MEHNTWLSWPPSPEIHSEYEYLNCINPRRQSFYNPTSPPPSPPEYSTLPTTIHHQSPKDLRAPNMGLEAILQPQPVVLQTQSWSQNPQPLFRPLPLQSNWNGYHGDMKNTTPNLYSPSPNLHPVQYQSHDQVIRTRLETKPLGPKRKQKSMPQFQKATPKSEKGYWCMYKCPETGRKCDKAFVRREHLVRHQRTHTQERPFKCEFCGFRISRSDNFTQHLRTHTKPNGKKGYFEEAVQLLAAKGSAIPHERFAR